MFTRKKSNSANHSLHQSIGWRSEAGVPLTAVLVIIGIAGIFAAVVSDLTNKGMQSTRSPRPEQRPATGRYR